ncbi:MAG: thioredoxin family protein [Planctomycetales bacterium]
MRRLLRFSLISISLLTSAFAGEYNTALNIGDKAPVWTALPGTDGKQHGVDEFKDKELLVVIFTCNSCPVATDYEDRIIDFCKKYGGEKGKVGVVAINVNKVKADLLPAMTQRAKDKKYPFPYLFDESQKIAKDFGATFTPEFFLLNKDRKVVYMGGMDDHSDPALAKTHHLVNAVEATLKGEKPPSRRPLPSVAASATPKNASNDLSETVLLIIT